MPTIQPPASAPVQQVIDALRAAGCDPRCNSGGWMARCPAHDDRTPSLSISEGSDGKALVRCHAECRMESIVAALSLKPADLFPKNNGSPRHPLQAKQSTPPKTHLTLDDAIAAAAYHVKREHPDVVQTVYRYSETYARLRLDWAADEPGKTVREISKPSTGGWILKRPPGKTPLYRIAEIEEAAAVYVCEGEKPCDAGWAIGLPCTTSGASSSARTADWSGLAGRFVVILPDADPPGEKYAEAVVEQLLSVFPPAEVRVLRLPGLGDGEDLHEFCNVHRASCEAADIKAEIEALAEATNPEQLAEPQHDSERSSASAQFHRTDLGNAERLVLLFGHLLRFTDATGWLAWTGTHWAADRMGEVEHFATETVRAMYEAAAAIQNRDARETLGKWAASSESRKRLRDMISLAESMQPVRIRSEDLDQNPWLLNLENGTIDLKTGKLRGHDPADLITRCCPVKYDPAAKAERFEKFLAEIMGGDEGMIAFLLRALGHCLTGDTSERAIFILHGVGRNGKSTLVNLFRALLGDYARHARSETILARRNDSIPCDLARLRGARFVTVTEIEEGRKMDVAG